MSVMVLLAGAWHGAGHMMLLRAAMEWLGVCKAALIQQPAVPTAPVEKTTEDGSTDTQSAGAGNQSMLECACCLLTYISDVLTALRSSI